MFDNVQIVKNEREALHDLKIVFDIVKMVKNEREKLNNEKNHD